MPCISGALDSSVLYSLSSVVKEDACEVGTVRRIDNMRSGKRGEIKTEEDINFE